MCSIISVKTHTEVDSSEEIGTEQRQLGILNYKKYKILSAEILGILYLHCQKLVCYFMKTDVKNKSEQKLRNPKNVFSTNKKLTCRCGFKMLFDLRDLNYKKSIKYHSSVSFRIYLL